LSTIARATHEEAGGSGRDGDLPPHAGPDCSPAGLRRRSLLWNFIYLSARFRRRAATRIPDQRLDRSAVVPANRCKTGQFLDRNDKKARRTRFVHAAPE